VDGRQGVNGLQLNDHAVANHQINAQPGVQADAFVRNGQGQLTDERDLPQRKLATEAGLVDGFHEARSKFAMDFYRRANYLVRSVTGVAGHSSPRNARQRRRWDLARFPDHSPSFFAS
jgi:hypothetical protein